MYIYCIHYTFCERQKLNLKKRSREENVCKQASKKSFSSQYGQEMTLCIAVDPTEGTKLKENKAVAARNVSFVFCTDSIKDNNVVHCDEM